MGSPVQTDLSKSTEYPYVKLIWDIDYYPGIYSNYPGQRFPTEKAALLFGAGNVNGHCAIAKVYSGDDILIATFERETV